MGRSSAWHSSSSSSSSRAASVSRATRPRASSSTDLAANEARRQEARRAIRDTDLAERDESSGNGPAPAVVARRDFFRSFLQDALGAAHSSGILGASGLLGATLTAGSTMSAEAAALAAAAGVGFSDLVLLDAPPSGAGAPGAGRPGGGLAGPAGSAYRSPYRVDLDAVIVLDQRRFPDATIEVPCLSAGHAAATIRERLAQGPGTIAAVGAYGLVRGARARAAAPGGSPDTGVAAPGGAVAPGQPRPDPLAALYADANELVAAAPWIVPLRRAIDRLVDRAVAAAAAGVPPWAAADALGQEADALAMEELFDVSSIVAAGLDLLRAESRRSEPRRAAAGRSETGGRETRGPETGVAVAGAADAPLRALVHGPIGALGFGQVGSVLGALQGAAAAGVALHVWVAEARPALSGTRTAWELANAGLPHELVPDAAVGGLIAAGAVDVVLLGALGIGPSGEVTDEPGAYALAVLASRHGLPVYVFAPRSTLFAPAGLGSSAWFDVTPPELVSAFVSALGVLRPPFGAALDRLARYGAPPTGGVTAPVSEAAGR